MTKNLTNTTKMQIMCLNVEFKQYWGAFLVFQTVMNFFQLVAPYFMTSNFFKLCIPVQALACVIQILFSPILHFIDI